MLNSLKSLGSHIACSKVACCSALPVLMYFLESFLCILCNVERVCTSRCNGINLSFKPFKRIFRESLTASWHLCIASDNKLSLANSYRKLFHNAAESVASALDYRKIFCFLITFRNNKCTVSFYLGHFFKKHIAKTLCTGCYFDFFHYFVVHNSRPPILCYLYNTTQPHILSIENHINSQKSHFLFFCFQHFPTFVIIWRFFW